MKAKKKLSKPLTQQKLVFTENTSTVHIKNNANFRKTLKNEIKTIIANSKSNVERKYGTDYNLKRIITKLNKNIMYCPIKPNTY